MKAVGVGDYVLATKYSDGDPQDHWCIGFVARIDADKGRVHVVDVEGKLFRGNGFRRAQKISPRMGTWLLSHRSMILSSGESLWLWARRTPDDYEVQSESGGK